MKASRASRTASDVMRQIIVRSGVTATFTRWTLAVTAATASVAMSGCGDTLLTSPKTPAASVESQQIGSRSLSLQWNEIARQLVIEHRTDPPMAARYYALLSVAQFDAATSASRKLAAQPAAIHAAIARASSAILAYAYPDRALMLEEIAAASVRGSEDGDAVGAKAARQVLVHARNDRSDLEWAGSVPTGDGLWFSSATPTQSPLRPRWGEVRPWHLKRGSEVRPEPPPAFGSAEFRTALAEVRALSDNRTEAQLAIALFWADGAGSATPPGHWNAIASELIARYQLDEVSAARTFALLNTAVMDAGISCWDAKYHYWFIRPPQADPAITTPVGLPNFPSYVSGHATFSGAASEVLASMFPREASHLRAMAEEAALSRLYGGIHYRFDNEVGLRMGRKIGALAVQRWKNIDGPLMPRD